MWEVEYRATDRLHQLRMYAFGKETFPTLAEALMRLALRLLTHHKQVDLTFEEPKEDILLVARLTTADPSQTSSSCGPLLAEQLRRLTTLFEQNAPSSGDSSPKMSTETEPPESSQPSESSGPEEGTPSLFRTTPPASNAPSSSKRSRKPPGGSKGS